MTRCFGDGDDTYAAYHDTEWGVPPREFGVNESELFERLSLEVFQVGLSWVLILRRRGAFREAFQGFDPEAVAAFTDADAHRLAENSEIIRNRRKIDATINNAARVRQMHARGETLAGLFAAHRPAVVVNRRESLDAVPAFTDESSALAKALKDRGFSFVGPTNVYAMMQALGLVDDHLASCPVALQAPALTDASRAPDIWDEVR